MVQIMAISGLEKAADIQTTETSSVILLAIVFALTAIQFIAFMFEENAAIDERINNIKKNVEELENAYSRLSKAMEKSYWIFSDEERKSHEFLREAIEMNIKSLEEQAALAKDQHKFHIYAELIAQIEELKQTLQGINDNSDIFDIYNQKMENLNQQIENYQEMIEEEKGKRSGKADGDKIKEWENEIYDIEMELKDLERTMLETLAGTDIKSAIDEFGDALIDAYCAGEDAAISLGEVTKNVLKNAVVEALKKQFLAKAINDAVLYLGEAMGDGVLSDEEKEQFETMVQAGADVFNAALEGVGDWIKDISDPNEDALSGAVRSMSEETGGIVAGRLNAVIINQADTNATLRQSLIYQQETAANTYASAEELRAIKSSLQRIENSSENSLLSKGIS